MKNLLWNTCDKGSWCSLLSVNIDHSHFNNMEGVYIIWQGGGQIIKVGQGTIKDRLYTHRKDPAITLYNNLFVTWATVPIQSDRGGIERYLGNILSPRVGVEFPDTTPIEVNLPWQYK